MELQNAFQFKKKSNEAINRKDDTEANFDTFIPMINDSVKHFTQSNNADSTCTRFIRKKFVCIIVFLISIITVCQLIDTILNKLPNHEFVNISQLLSKYFFDDLAVSHNETLIE